MTEKQSVLISAMRYEAKDILSVEMVSAQGKNLVQFSAGGHIDVFFREGLVRQYSLINDPEEKNRYQFAVLLEKQGRGGSAFVHKSLRVGDVIEVSQPRNNFKINVKAKSMLNWQIPILTEGEHSNARIINMNVKKINELLKEI